MKMWKGVAVVIAVALVAGAEAPAIAQSDSQSFINGFGPYVLGTPMTTVLNADPALTPGSRLIFSSKVPGTVAYSRNFTAPLGGYNYRATLALIFWRDYLAAVIIEWGTLAFPSVDDWRLAATALSRQLRTTYPANMIYKDYPPTRSTPLLLTLRDPNGNRLDAFATERDFSVNLDYVAADYANAVDATPNPAIRY